MKNKIGEVFVPDMSDIFTCIPVNSPTGEIQSNYYQTDRYAINEINRNFDLDKKELYIEYEKIDMFPNADFNGNLVEFKYGKTVYREIYDFSSGEAVLKGIQNKTLIPAKEYWSEIIENEDTKQS